MNRIVLTAALLTAVIFAQAQKYTLNGVEHETVTVPVAVSNFNGQTLSVAPKGKNKTITLIRTKFSTPLDDYNALARPELKIGNIIGHPTLGWDDTDATENPRMVVVVSDTLFTALFQWVADSVRIDEIDGFTQPVSLFPNPASHTVIIRSERDCTVAFLSADGREVMRMVCRAGDTSVNIQHLAQGVYFLRVIDLHQPPIKLIVTKE